MVVIRLTNQCPCSQESESTSLNRVGKVLSAFNFRKLSWKRVSKDSEKGVSTQFALNLKVL